MKAYRIRHKLSGLYYQPIRGYCKEKTNLGKHGKVYITRKPIFSDYSQITVNRKLIEKYNLKVNYGNIIETKESDWEVIEYILLPKEQYDILIKVKDITTQVKEFDPRNTADWIISYDKDM